MNGLRSHNVVFGLAALLAAASAITAQQQGPRINCVYPAGGKQGSTTQISVEGQFISSVKSVVISGGGGVKATLVEFIKPVSQREIDSLRDQIKDLQEKRRAAMQARQNKAASQPATRPWTDEDEKKVAEILEKIAVFTKARNSPAFAETAIVKLEIAPDAETGRRELRLMSATGLTNPLAIMVGCLPEYYRPVREAEAQKLKDLAVNRQQTNPPVKTEMKIELPALINGQLPPGGVDRCRFKATKGQNLVIAADARKLIPYISDAVPGWFQVFIGIYDSDGNEIAYADHYQFDPDPILCCRIPKDGEYTLEIRDALYRGRDDFVYRVTIGELPFVTGVYPLGGKEGEQTIVELQGWNLPADKQTINYKEGGIYSVKAGQDSRCMSRALFAADSLPECVKKGGNVSQQTAQQISLPTIVNGRIEKQNECDVYSFKGRSGQKIVAEVAARRLNSPLDSILKLADSEGKQLAVNDDHEDKSEGLYTHQSDSLLTATLPADGDYYLSIRDIQGKFGPEYAYRLRVSEPMPDFELIVTPSALNVRGGQSTAITVYAIRKDGFAGDISLSLKDAPQGFTLGNPKIPAGQDKAGLTVTTPRTAFDDPIKLNLIGKATINSTQIVRKAIPAEDMMQAFAYRHLVPADELEVAFFGQPMARAKFEVIAGSPVKIPAGGLAKIEVGMPKALAFNEVIFELKDPPEGICVEKTSQTREGAEIAIRCDDLKIKSGLKGSLIFNIFVERAATQQAGSQPASSSASATQSAAANPPAKANIRKVPMGVLPAIPFEVVGGTKSPETQRAPTGKK